MISNKKIFVDTELLIYYIEEHSDYIAYLNSIFDVPQKNGNNILTSVITLLEVLVLPYKNNDIVLAKKYQDILENSKDISLYPVTTDISRYAAQLRAKYNLRTPDSIQIATAIISQADIFFTNDLSFKRVSEIEILILDEEIKKSIG